MKATGIRVFRQAGRWTIDCETGTPAGLTNSRGAALQAALDFAATVAPAVVVVFTTEGRARLTIPIAGGGDEPAPVSSDDLIRFLCSDPDGGGTRCWSRPVYRLSTGQVCQDHAFVLVWEQGLEGLQPDDRGRFRAENPGYASR